MDAETLTVRMPVQGGLPAADRPMAQFRFDRNGTLVHQDWPTSYDSLRLVMRQDPSEGMAVILDGPDDVVSRFQLGPVPTHMDTDDTVKWVFGNYSLRMHDLVALTEHATGTRTYYFIHDLGTPLPVRDLSLRGTGMRVLGNPGDVMLVIDETGMRVEGWKAEEVGGGRVTVLQNSEAPGARAMLLHIESLRLQVATRYTRDEWDLLRARFAVPGAPDGATAEYRFDHNGRLAREIVPLTSGDSVEEQLGSARYAPGAAWLRIVVNHSRELVQAGGEDVVRRVVRRALQGTNAQLFRLDEPTEAVIGHAPELRGGFTVTELPGPGHGPGELRIRRHYTPGGALVYRDVPVDLPGGQRGYLRVASRSSGSGERARELRVLDADGALLDDWRAVRLGEHRVAVVPERGPVRSWLVVSPETGAPVVDRDSHQGLGGVLPMVFRRIDQAGSPTPTAETHVVAPPEPMQVEALEALETQLPQDARLGTLSGQTVRLEFAPDGSVARRSVVGRSLGVKLLNAPEELADRLGENGFSLQDVATHRVVHFDGMAQPVFSDERVDDAILRHDLTAPGFPTLHAPAAGAGEPSVRAAGAPGAGGRFAVEEIAEGSAEAALSRYVANDLWYGHRYFFAADRTPTVREIRLQNWGYLRIDLRIEGGPLQVVDTLGRVRPGLQARLLENGRVEIRRLADADAPLASLVLDLKTQELVKETHALRGRDHKLTGYVQAGYDLDDPAGLGAFQLFRNGWPRRGLWLHSDPNRDGVVHEGAMEMRDDDERVVFTRPWLGHSVVPRLIDRSSARVADESEITDELHPLPEPVLQPTEERAYEFPVRTTAGYEFLKVEAPAGDPGLQLLSMRGELVDVPAEFSTHATGLMVQVPVPDAPEQAAAQYRFIRGDLHYQELPLGGAGAEEELGSLRVEVRRTPNGWEHGLLGSSSATSRFHVGRAQGVAGRDMPDWFSLTNIYTRVRRLYAPGAALAWREVPLGSVASPGGRWYLRIAVPRMLRTLVKDRVVQDGDFYLRLAGHRMAVVDESGRLWWDWRARVLDGGLVELMPPDGAAGELPRVVIDPATARLVRSEPEAEPETEPEAGPEIEPEVGPETEEGMPIRRR
jgi:hypothetical protein